MGANQLSTSTFDKLADGTINQAAYDRRWSKSGNDGRNDTVSGNLDWVITPKFFVNFTTGYFRTNYTTPEDARGNATMHYLGNSNSDSYMTARGYPTIPASFQNASGYSPEISSSGYVRNILDRTYLNANSIWYKSLAGQHVFKFGMRYERVGNDIYNGYAEPRLNFYFGNPRATLDGRQVTGKYGYFYVYKPSTIGVVHSNNYSFWLQDSWTVNSKLTINAGVRAQNEHIPSYKQTADAIDLKFGFKDEIAPAPRLRLRPQGRRQVEGVRQLRLLLPGDPAVPPPQRVGRRPLDQLLLDARHLRLDEHQLRRGPHGLPGHVHRGMGRAPQLQPAGRGAGRVLQPAGHDGHRPRPEADPERRVHAGHGPRAEQHDVARRPLRPQVALPDDRGRGHRAAGPRRGLHRLEPGLRLQRDHVAVAARSSRRRTRRASTTPSRRACASASRTAGRRKGPTPTAGCGATTAASPARTRTAVSTRTSTATSTTSS